ncbi:hypothetical protein CEXT_741761 [Caerostris extrusa]|uniref:Uncharacterized protein n=1 Tax=Caerostris extrusa TaxID=172846 RepID=A0AAV4W841_CAEEX|nr:hypothetical protein CEXT_741761 [Caerostris extrusa]
MSTSAAVFFHCVELPSSSISRTFHPSSPIAATSSTSSCNTLCSCHLLLRATFSTANVFHCCRRLPLLPTSSTESHLLQPTSSSTSCDFLCCCHRLSLLPSS